MIDIAKEFYPDEITIFCRRCGIKLSFPAIEEEHGFLKSTQACPSCGVKWILYMARQK